MKLCRILIVVLVLLPIVIAEVIYSSKHEIIEGAWVYKLFIKDCEIIYIKYTLQPFDTTVVACPYTDLIRIWPLPIVYPWDEDWWEKYELDRLIGFSDNGLMGSYRSSVSRDGFGHGELMFQKYRRSVVKVGDCLGN